MADATGFDCPTRMPKNFNDGDEDDVAVSKPQRSMRAGTMFGRSIDGDGPPRQQSPLRINVMRGSSFDSDAPEKPQKVKDAEEKKAKVELAELLGQTPNTERGATFHLETFSSLQNGYLSSVNRLQPASKAFLGQSKDDRKKEKEKVKKYDSLKNAWET
jgi:hypothetical protein